MDDDEEYAKARVPGRLSFSKQFSLTGADRPKRFAYRVFDGENRNGFVQQGTEFVLRPTRSGRQQIKALFYVDDRNHTPSPDSYLIGER